MNQRIPTSRSAAESAIDRRQFMKAAAVGGAAAFAGSPTFAAQLPGSPAPVATGAATGKSAGADTVPLAPPDRQPPDLEVPEPIPRKVGWAIVGLGELALGEVMPAFRECKLSRPVALVSGHPEKAAKVAAAYGIDPQAIYDYQNFDKLAADPQVEVVYIVLPNSMHAEFTIRALRAGKHVICEKPMAVNVAEAERMIAAAREAQRKLMIAYRLHYEPMNQTAIELCRSQAYGQLKTISSSNCQNVEAPNIRLSAELAGGPVGDVGIYSINATRYLTGEEPVEVTAFAHHPPDDPRFREVPESVVYTLRFPSGVLAHCECSFGTSRSQSYRVVGTKGYVEMDPAFAYRGLRLRVKEEKNGTPQQTEILLPAVNQFSAEFDHFSDCVLHDRTPRTPGEEGLADLRVIAAIHEAARTGRAVKIS